MSVVDEMKKDKAKPVAKDRLVNAQKKIAELRELEFENQNLDERISANAKKIDEIKRRDLVDIFDSCGVTKLAIDADGNLPPYEIEVKTFYHASIPEENQSEAFEWLRKNKHGDMIKGTYTIQFGMGMEKQRKAFETLLKKNKIEFSYKFGVPWNTLTAFIKEQIEDYHREPPLKLLGATVGRMAFLVKTRKQPSIAKGKK